MNRFIKQTVKILILVVAVGTVLLSSACVKKEDGPMIKIESRIVDFGNINKKESPTIKSSIKVRNVGTEDLVLKELKPSCDCVEAEGSFPDTIAPGDKRIYAINIDLEAEYGQMEKKLYIRSNDKGEVEIIHLLANISD